VTRLGTPTSVPDGGGVCAERQESASAAAAARRVKDLVRFVTCRFSESEARSNLDVEICAEAPRFVIRAFQQRCRGLTRTLADFRGRLLVA